MPTSPLQLEFDPQIERSVSVVDPKGDRPDGCYEIARFHKTDVPGAALANARLFAAGEQMLAALTFFRSQYGDRATWPDDDVTALDLAEAAIAAAEGRP